MASTKLLSLGPLLSYFLDTSSAFTAMETPNLFLPSIASPWMDNFYKCILYGCVPSSVSSIFSTSLSGTRQKWRRHFAINAAESSNYVRWNGKIPQFDYILRISSLINTKHRYIYIYTRIRRDAIWSDVELSGNLLSKDSSRWMHIIALFLPEFWIRGPFLLSSTCRFVSFSFDFSSPYISFVPWIFTRIANLEILFRAFFHYHPIFLNFLIKKEREKGGGTNFIHLLFSIPRS